MDARTLTYHVYDFCLNLRDRNVVSFTVEEFEKRYRKHFGRNVPIVRTGYFNVAEIFLMNENLFGWIPEINGYRCILQEGYASGNPIPATRGEEKTPDMIELGKEDSGDEGSATTIELDDDDEDDEDDDEGSANTIELDGDDEDDEDDDEGSANTIELDDDDEDDDEVVYLDFDREGFGQPHSKKARRDDGTIYSHQIRLVEVITLDGDEESLDEVPNRESASSG